MCFEKKQKGAVQFGRFTYILICTLIYLLLLIVNLTLKPVAIVAEDYYFLFFFLVKDFVSAILLIFIYEKLFKKKEYRFILVTAVLVAVVIVNIALSILFIIKVLGGLSIAVMFGVELSGVYCVMIAVCQLARLNALEQVEKLKALEKEKRDLELYYLGLQLNPHFLFNTLNVTYIQARKEKARATSDMVMQLSELLRYQLYEPIDKKAMLKSEIKYIENYLELQKMRQIDVDIEYNKSGSPDGVMVYPFLTISFLENAFKHVNVNNDGEKFIKIFIAVEEKFISFVVKNTKSAIKEDDASSVKKRSGGVGIVNTKKRLDLLYPGKYELNFDSDEKYFNVELKIEVEND